MVSWRSYLLSSQLLRGAPGHELPDPDYRCCGGLQRCCNRVRSWSVTLRPQRLTTNRWVPVAGNLARILQKKAECQVEGRAPTRVCSWSGRRDRFRGWYSTLLVPSGMREPCSSPRMGSTGLPSSVRLPHSRGVFHPRLRVRKPDPKGFPKPLGSFRPPAVILSSELPRLSGDFAPDRMRSVGENTVVARTSAQRILRKSSGHGPRAVPNTASIHSPPTSSPWAGCAA